ncbi:MAG TPA: isovaleryl-CoA dehydrogenase [Candidatus Limnocylindria bacterium]|nr:isovaleryl-CoA dehydrogenase [Candidatus Limnocylindria bacterium]
MSGNARTLPTPTHEVLNQPPPLVDYDVFSTDRVLTEALEREGGGWAREQAARVGTLAGGDAMEWGRLANANPPVLHSHDRYGHRIDEVEFHPAWHALMDAAVSNELHALPWRRARPGAHVARAAFFFTLSQAEAGHGCPVSMTYSVVPALRAQPELAAEWEPRVCSTRYDPRSRPTTEKEGALFGMAMTEKQGGSDVRANTTRARPLGVAGPGQAYALTGHKWFCSAPMCDAFLVLAQTERGLSCFLLPRWRPDGSRNTIYIQRLKDKLGNRSNASSEIELDGAWARMVGEDGRGVATIIEMVTHTRLDCVIGASATMRQAVVQALHHARHRRAFGRRLVEHALMQNVLADLCLESEAATTAMMRLARAYDESASDPRARAFARLATAITKYWVCKRNPPVVAEALECLGGAGYVEESGLPRLFRESPLNSIWEGSGNVICLDVLRALAREPESLDAVLAEIAAAESGEPRLRAWVGRIREELQHPETLELRARVVVERMAVALQASLLLRTAPTPIAEAFCASRLTGDRGLAFGTLPAGCALDAILERHAVAH